jgi:hypothetical protein
MSVYEGHDDIIYTGQIDDRIEALKNSLPGYDGQHIVPDDFFSEDERDEYEALTQFRDDVQSQIGVGGWDNDSGMIAESYFDAYVNSDVEGMYGSAVIEALDKYLDWESIKDDYTERFDEFELDGVDYYVDTTTGY